MQARDPLGSIEDGLLTGEPLTDLLRKVVILGGRTGSAELRAWAKQELDGYGDGEVPRYRVLPVGIAESFTAGPMHVQGHAISAVEVSAYTGLEITNELSLRQPVAELARLAEGEDALHLTPAWGRLYASKRDDDDYFRNTYGVFYVLSRASVAGVVDRVKTQLADFVAEVRSASGSAPDEAPSKEAVAHATTVVINGGNPVLSWGNRNTISGATIVHQGDRDSLRAALDQAGISDQDWHDLLDAMREDAGGQDEESCGGRTRA